MLIKNRYGITQGVKYEKSPIGGLNINLK